MDLLNTAPAGLDALAEQCSSWAGGIAGAAAPQVATSGQTSAAAVAGINDRVALGAHAMAGRMSATAVKLSTTAASFAAQDSRSADLISAVATQVV